MKDKFINQVIVEGYVFDHSLTHRVTGEYSKNPGTDFINGTINIAIDDEGLNVVPVVFSYVTATYKSGNANRTYQVLDQLINNASTFQSAGTGATRVKVTGSVDTNDFLGRDGEMVCAKRVAGSFCDIVQSTDGKADFEADMLIYAVRPREVEDGDDYLELDGYCFNFRGDLLPVTFSVVSPQGINYFESLDVSADEPVFEKVWGQIVSTVVKKEEVIESNWGESQVKVSSRSFTAWQVTGSNNNCGEFGDDSVMTKDELEKAKKARTEYVAAEKARQEEYRNSQQGKAGFPEAKDTAKTSSPTAVADYKF